MNPPRVHIIIYAGDEANLRSAWPRGLFFTVQRSTLKNHPQPQGRKPLPLVRYLGGALLRTGKVPFDTPRLSVVGNSKVVRYSGAENVLSLRK